LRKKVESDSTLLNRYWWCFFCQNSNITWSGIVGAKGKKTNKKISMQSKNQIIQFFRGKIFAINIFQFKINILLYFPSKIWFFKFFLQIFSRFFRKSYIFLNFPKTTRLFLDVFIARTVEKKVCYQKSQVFFK
jgi:hypothetical protein